MITIILLTFLTAGTLQATPPDTLGLHYCYTRAEQHYPLENHIKIQRKINKLNEKIARSNHYPNLTLKGRASVQSEVTDINVPGPTPGTGIPEPSRDQYEAALNVSQTIFNHGAISIRKELEQARGQQKIHATEVDQHQIRKQVDRLYFGILLKQQRQKINALLIKNLRKQLATVRSKVKNGVLVPRQKHILKAELMQARQDSVRIRSDLRASYKVLGILIDQKLPPDTRLAIPEVTNSFRAPQPQRPEYELFSSQMNVLDQKKELINTRKWPAISAFATAAYGRPGFNFLSDDFHDYYIAGLKLRWNIRNLWQAEREERVISWQKNQIQQRQKAFTRQLNAAKSRLSEQIASIKSNMDRDRAIIQIRRKIVDETASQLENGVITATEYVTELTRAHQARLALRQHRVELAKTRIKYATALGIPLSRIFNK